MRRRREQEQPFHRRPTGGELFSRCNYQVIHQAHLTDLVLKSEAALAAWANLLISNPIVYSLCI
jgi:hypothetical protein